MMAACSSGLRPGLSSTLMPTALAASLWSNARPFLSSLSLTRTRTLSAMLRAHLGRLRDEAVGEDRARGTHAGARREARVALLAQDDLDGAEDGDDVELVVVAEVRDAEDLALHRVLSAGDGDVGALHEALVDGVGLERGRLQHRRHRVRRHLREDLEAEGLHAGARSRGEAFVTREDARERLLLHQAQGLRQTFDERHGGRVRALVLHLVLQLAGEIEVPLAELGLLAARPRLLRERDEAEARRQHQRFLRAGDE